MLNYKKISTLVKSIDSSKMEFYKLIDVTPTGFRQTMEKKTMKVDTLERIAIYFDKPISYFFDEVEITSPDMVPKEKYYELLEKYNNCLEEKDILSKSEEEPAPANKKRIKSVHK